MNFIIFKKYFSPRQTDANPAAGLPTAAAPNGATAFCHEHGIAGPGRTTAATPAATANANGRRPSRLPASSWHDANAAAPAHDGHDGTAGDGHGRRHGIRNAAAPRPWDAADGTNAYAASAATPVWGDTEHDGAAADAEHGATDAKHGPADESANGHGSTTDVPASAAAHVQASIFFTDFS
jgi:hypothetical protein